MHTVSGETESLSPLITSAVGGAEPSVPTRSAGEELRGLAPLKAPVMVDGNSSFDC